MHEQRQNLEIEIKLRLDAFPDYLKLLGILGNPDSEHRQVNCFFDSEDHQLLADHWALRVRVEDRWGLITLKGTAAETSGIAVVREEMEERIDRAQALSLVNLQGDVLDVDCQPIRTVKERYPGVSLAKLVMFDNLRLSKEFKIGDYMYTLELDRTDFPDGSTDYELEIELEHTDQTPVVTNYLRRLFGTLNIPFETQEATKFARALERSGRF